MVDSKNGSSAASVPDKPSRSRWVRITRIGVTGIAALVLAAFFVAPPLVKNVLEKQLTQTLSTPRQARAARIDRVRINPLTLSCTIEGLAVTAADGAPFVRWRSFFASLDLRSLVTRGWRLRKVALDGFSGRIAVRPDGSLDFADLLASAPPPTDGKPLRLHINTLVVTDAHIDYADASLPGPFATQIGPVNFAVRDFQIGGPGRAPGEFTAVTESGETFSWQGTLSVSPIASRGEIRIGGFAIKKYTPFYGHRVRFDVLDGKMDAALRYEIDGSSGAIAARVSDSTVTLRDFKLAERGRPAPVVAVETVALTGIAIDGRLAPGARQTLHVGRIEIDNSAVALRRDARGLNLEQLLTPADAGPAASPGAPAGDLPPPAVSVGELIARNAVIDVEDATLETPFRTQAVVTTFSVKEFSLEKLDAPLALEFDARLPADGRLHAVGRLALAPLKGRLSAELSGAPLALANAHAGQYLDARIDRGLVSASGVVDIDPAAGITLTGETAVSDFAVTDTAGGPVQSWQNLALRGIAFASHPALKVTIREIALDAPATQVVMLPDGRLNLATLLKPAAASPAGTGAAPAAQSSFAIPHLTPGGDAAVFLAIDKVSLNNGRVDFSDRSISPAVKTSLDHINATVSGLSSDTAARADVDVQARIDSAASVSLAGRINPLASDLYSDLRFAINNAALAPLGPYVGKYAGRALASGTLNVAVNAKVAGRNLDTANVITLDRFALGGSTDSPDATSLPVGLAIALLRDRDGRIVLDIPVQGSLDDPNFRYGRAVWRAVGNLLVKAATAPFSLLASLLGGSDAAGAGAVATGEETDFSTIGFASGAAVPSDEGLRKLALIARAFRERPALQLSITGGYDASRDRDALRRAFLQEQLVQERQAGVAGTPAVQTTSEPGPDGLAPADEARLVERLYRRNFNIPEPSVEPAPRPAAEPAPARTTSRQRESFAVVGGKIRPGSRVIRRPAAPAAISSGPASPAAAASADTAPAAPLPSLEEMRARLLETIQVDEERLRRLAAERAEAVKNHLTGEGVEADRIKLAGAPAEGAVASLSLGQGGDGAN